MDEQLIARTRTTAGHTRTSILRDVQEQLIAYRIQERQIIKVPKEQLKRNILQEQLIVNSQHDTKIADYRHSNRTAYNAHL